MDTEQLHLLSEWASGVTAAIAYMNDLSVEQKRGIIEDLARFKESIGTLVQKEDPTAT